MSRARASSRTPPPALFLHPSSGASHATLPSFSTQGVVADQHVPATRSEHMNPERSASTRSESGAASRPQRIARAASVRSTDRIDALWAEMQAALEEAESSASGGTRVFGLGHEQKLAELRSAQIGLAQAWARSEAEEATVTSSHDEATSSIGSEAHNLRSTFESLDHDDKNGTGQVKTFSRSTKNAYEGKPENFYQFTAGVKEETEMDIALGRKRRQANDKYFERVNDGVVHVVAKLEEVAKAMHAVEKESQGTWNERTSVDKQY